MKTGQKMTLDHLNI